MFLTQHLIVRVEIHFDENSVPVVENIMLENDLVDIWRIRNPAIKRFTWRQKLPIIQRRLDY